MRIEVGGFPKQQHSMTEVLLERDVGRYTRRQRLYRFFPRMLRNRLLKGAPTKLSYSLRCGDGDWQRRATRPDLFRDGKAPVMCANCGTVFKVRL